MPSFETFVHILGEHGDARCSLLELGSELRSRIGADWTDGTAQTTAKILLDWARHTGLAPSVFERPARRKTPPEVPQTGSLFA